MQMFNINYHVGVKLTQKGKDILVAQGEELRKTYNISTPYKLPKEDKLGYTWFQMHDLMSTLGAYCTIGSDLPFETEIKMGGPYASYETI